MAHGRSGVCFALLAAAQTGVAVPAWFWAWLKRSAEKQLKATKAAALDPTGKHIRWCSGAAGFTLLWVKAYQATGDPIYLQRARAEAMRAYEFSSSYPDLCCGIGGRAFALLSVGRIDPDPAWRRHAAELAEQALLSRTPTKWPFGLFKGQSGLYCLARDLAKPEGGGFPCLEGLACS
jgi:serine/threonine-protein kinase